MAKTPSDKVQLDTRNDTPGNAKAESIATLNAVLADIIDATNATRQAHWNVKGSHFYGLHKMFEEFYGLLAEQSDELAERAVQLGGIPDGTTQGVGARTRITPYDANLLDGLDHCQALADRYAELAKHLRKGIDSTDEAGDADTSDLLTQVSRVVDKSLWMIEAHLQGKN
ncbi:DNA starvation/stationary phase protection protein Dps [Roseomonas sp. KE2513]|uniref:DNA starvation/stationary phase protection protein Dps n=1 Tax=Roseomonas sp. KE2513 TaxID=2479202 RepID=UPI0018DFFE9A|nr:DNA starvation/stationary phase protection protein Dps [Roseomonas sp. KE2513]MBI0537965.1 DNA starvation/stationary phase protection protein Dps [Roseomonas sp. KE2513]